MKNLELELIQAASVIVNDLCKVQPGETVSITADTITDETVVNAIAGQVITAGGKPLVMWYKTPGGVGKASDKDTPYKALGAAIGNSDVWIELGFQWLLYSSVQEIALSLTSNLRHLNIVGMNPSMMDRMINGVDFELLSQFQRKLTGMTKAAVHVRMTTPAGTDLEFDNDPNCPFYCELGLAQEPGTAYLSGQICWFHKCETLNGTLVFDGSLCPSNGMLNSPVILDIEKGYIKKVRGGADAQKFEAWLASFNDPLMYRMAHVCYGYHPSAALCGNCVEDERIWGSTEWGIGYLPAADCPPDGVKAASHCDGICLNTSVWLDGVQVQDCGRVVHPDLVEMAEKLHQ